jgi:sugar O-acyltransferase (sialic acid O-acetyltransferase NeuD family)
MSRIEPDQRAGRFVIVGAGALGRELKQWIEMSGRQEAVVFLDDFNQGPSIIGSIESYERQPEDEVLVAIGEPKDRQKVADRFSKLGTFIANSAVTGNCAVGPGCMLFPHALVSADVVIGAGCIVNIYSSVGHDVHLGDFCTVSSHVDITGRVKVGNRVFFGSGARVVPRVTIGDDAYIGAGAVVVKDVPAGAKVFGNPAREIA